MVCQGRREMKAEEVWSDSRVYVRRHSDPEERPVLKEKVCYGRWRGRKAGFEEEVG